MYEHEWTCAWGDADPMGIAYYPRLIDAMHRAGEAFMRDAGVAYWAVPEEFGIHLPIVTVDAEFSRPVEVGDTLHIAVEPDLGTTSLTLAFTASHADGEVAYTGVEKHVCVAEADRESEALPEALRTAVEALAG